MPSVFELARNVIVTFFNVSTLKIYFKYYYKSYLIERLQNNALHTSGHITH